MTNPNLETIDAPLLVFTEANPAAPEQLTVGAKRLLSQVRQLTSQTVVAVSPAGVEEAEFGRYGCEQVWYYTQPYADSYQVGAGLADVLYAGIQQVKPGGVFLPSTAWGKDATAHLAARLHSGGAVDVTEVQVKDGQLVAAKMVLGGTWETSFQIRRGIPVIAVKTAGLIEQPFPSPKPVESATLSFDLADSTQRIKVIENQPSSNLSTLAEASVAVCGGRGTGGDFSLVYQLAEKLGGAVGATRVACEEGWIERSAQVGQSGISIAPSLYVGLGISGDLHHVSGIRGAKTIVAVSDDSEAPIFELCDFGVVGDYEEVVSQALENL